jgi:hypothetical protein
MKKVIVLGNGFDLDLGWNTSYKQFFLTQYGSRSVTDKDDSLIQYIINHAGEKDTWYDLEKMLSDYCVLKSKEERTEQQLLHDNQDYKELRTKLKKFIAEGTSKPADSNSFAYKILEKCIESAKKNPSTQDFIPSIFSFNYSDLGKVVSQIDPKYKFSYHAVHGTLEKDNIIFGFNNRSDIKKEYRCYQKSHDDSYESHNILPALMDASDIIFFGMSMGDIDGAYYDEVLRQTSVVGGYRTRMHKNITFVTYNSESKLAIKNNLQDAGIDTMVLCNTNNVQFLLTEDSKNLETRNEMYKLLTTI